MDRRKPMRASVVTLGTFDGVHRGHQRILVQVVRRAQRLGARSVVLAFSMPPRHSGKALQKPVLLTSVPEKLEILKRLGVQHVHLLVFDRATASTSPEDFFTKTLVDRFGAHEVVVGPRVAFGKNRAGRLSLLKNLGIRHGVRVHVVPPVRVKGVPVSSRRIRMLLTQGRVEKARQLLGYSYFVIGKVIPGSQRGRDLGFPTANIHVDPLKILPRGVFWVKAFLSPTASGIDGVCNVGNRPTFTPEAQKLHCEVFLLKKTPHLYGKTLRIAFLRKIRPERRFPSLEHLQRQIAKDVRKSQKWAHAFSLQNDLISL